MYLTFGRATVAIDAKTCRERWTYVWQPKGQEISPANRGGAIKDGKLVRGTADGYLIALDMAHGSLLWSKPIASFARGQYFSMPPLIYGDLIIAGPSGADFGAKNLSAPSSSRPASRYGSSISSPMPASQAPTPGKAPSP
jgi:alcohol dehydrogenase (cytochrome c)